LKLIWRESLWRQLEYLQTSPALPQVWKAGWGGVQLLVADNQVEAALDVLGDT
jgi:hypothetical protein